ncbi:hypothetical protein GCM10027277_56710 [Pseudoduganella ginsengisoli]|uniref:Uncharacterized protein n=1 Tax=Pseudoduganella ginsengisoli TaxID=1462440 RepID=A0A6L6Q387_9BURK|nr:hypothetical protein [Pseudoduganella ginsengisoli]MTW03956.1 hypothetical protein [Pseudoduganella ginsengisoli]
METMRAYWHDCGVGPGSDAPVDVTLIQAKNIWSDCSPVEGNFLGLIDSLGRTIQFCFTDGVPDHMEDARHLKIVLLDFPIPEKSGSYSRQVSIGEVHKLIDLAFNAAADHLSFPGVNFVPW